MNVKDYFMLEIWPLLDDEQKARMLFLAEIMTRYPPPESEKATG